MRTVKEGLCSGDLRHNIFKQISVDQFEPKTGDIEDVIVVGFYAVDQRSARDLYSFLNSTYLPFRDIEVSQNPDSKNRFMVFIELNREPEATQQIETLVSEVERLAGRLSWQIAVGHNSPSRYQDGEWPQQVAAAAQQYSEPAALAPDRSAARIAEHVKTFFRRSDLADCRLEENVLTLTGRSGTVKLQFEGIGTNKGLLKKLGLTESAINQNFDPHLLKQLNTMLGSVRAEALDNHLILYREGSSVVLAAQPL